MNNIELIPLDTILINRLTRHGSLIIRNNSNAPVIYKIKTTNPQNYTVKPNIGIIAGHSKVIIKIILQDIVGLIKMHKFMIQIHYFDKEPTNIKEFVKNPDNRPFINKKYNVDYESEIKAIEKDEKGRLEFIILIFILYMFILLVKKLLNLG